MKESEIMQTATATFTALLLVNEHVERGVTPHCLKCKQMFTGDTTDEVLDNALKHYGLYPMTPEVSLIVLTMINAYEATAEDEQSQTQPAPTEIKPTVQFPMSFPNTHLPS